MVKIQTCICDLNMDARIRERYWYKELNANLNTISTQTSREENKARCNEYGKQYRVDNKLILLANAREYAVKNKERIAALASEIIHYEPCGCEVKNGSIAGHNKSKRHLNNIAQIKN